MEPTAATTPPAAAAGESPKAKRRRKAAALPLGDVTNLLLPNTPTNPTTRRPRPLLSDTSASTCSRSAAPPSGASSPTLVSKPSSSSSAAAAAVDEDHSLVKSASATPVSKPSSSDAVHEDHSLVKSASATPVSKPSFGTDVVHEDHSLVKSASVSASAMRTPVSKPSSSHAVDEDHSLFKSVISTVYTRRSERRRTRNHPTGDNVTLPAGTASCPPPGRVTRTSKKDAMTHDSRPISSSVPCHQAKKKQNTRMGNLSSVMPKLPEDFVKKQRTYFEEIDAFELPEEEASETDLE